MELNLEPVVWDFLCLSVRCCFVWTTTWTWQRWQRVVQSLIDVDQANKVASRTFKAVGHFLEEHRSISFQIIYQSATDLGWFYINGIKCIVWSRPNQMFLVFIFYCVTCSSIRSLTKLIKFQLKNFHIFLLPIFLIVYHTAPQKYPIISPFHRWDRELIMNRFQSCTNIDFWKRESASFLCLRANMILWASYCVRFLELYLHCVHE